MDLAAHITVMASTTHVSLPKAFNSCNTTEWFQCYEICCHVNGWDNDKMEIKLSTVLEDKELVIWHRMIIRTMRKQKKKIVDVIMPVSFVSLDDFTNTLNGQ